MIDATIDGAVATLSLDSPPLNLLSDRLRGDVLSALGDFRARGVRAVVLTGAGRAFCAGADLRDEAKLTPADVQAFLDADEAVFAALAEFPGATIAAVNGYAYGGGLELALACDVRVAARSATLAGVGVKIGVTVSTARLARVVAGGARGAGLPGLQPDGPRPDDRLGSAWQPPGRRHSGCWRRGLRRGSTT